MSTQEIPFGLPQSHKAKKDKHMSPGETRRYIRRQLLRLTSPENPDDIEADAEDGRLDDPHWRKRLDF
jgi:hypothetical protein